MKVTNPPEVSCCSRSRSRWSTRSASVSTCPYSMVAFVLMPSACAMPWISHHRSGSGLPVYLSSLAGLAREAAEGAREDTDVGRRDVAVDDEVHAITLAPGLDVIGHASDAEEVVGLEEGEAVLAAQTLARAHLVPNGLEPAVTESHGMSPRPACARRSGWLV